MRALSKHVRVCIPCWSKQAPEKQTDREEVAGGGMFRKLFGKLFTGFALLLGVLILAGYLWLKRSEFEKKLPPWLQASAATKNAEEAAPLRRETLSLRSDVLFGFGKSELKPEAEQALARVAAVLAAQPDARFVIRGYTDGLGSDTINVPLSLQRAEAVRQWLKTKGHIAAERMAVEGKGSSEPLAPNKHADGSDNPQGRELNRRVTITVIRALADLPAPSLPSVAQHGRMTNL